MNYLMKLIKHPLLINKKNNYSYYKEFYKKEVYNEKINLKLLYLKQVK